MPSISIDNVALDAALIQNNGGFCYYDECALSGSSCDDGYTCTVTINEENCISYRSGVCEVEIGGSTNSAQRFEGISGVIIIGLAISCII